eukprot:160397-Chlamydomonas_euryale.AAC.6
MIISVHHSPPADTSPRAPATDAATMATPPRPRDARLSTRTSSGRPGRGRLLGRCQGTSTAEVGGLGVSGNRVQINE